MSGFKGACNTGRSGLCPYGPGKQGEKGFVAGAYSPASLSPLKKADRVSGRPCSALLLILIVQGKDRFAVDPGATGKVRNVLNRTSFLDRRL